MIIKTKRKNKLIVFSIVQALLFLGIFYLGFSSKEQLLKEQMENTPQFKYIGSIFIMLSIILSKIFLNNFKMEMVEEI